MFLSISACLIVGSFSLMNGMHVVGKRVSTVVRPTIATQGRSAITRNGEGDNSQDKSFSFREIVNTILYGDKSSIVAPAPEKKSLSAEDNSITKAKMDKFYYVGLTPGKKLKTPSETIADIDEFIKSQGELVADQLRMVTYNDRILTAHILLQNACMAYCMCNAYESDKFQSKVLFEHTYVGSYQKWSRDPVRIIEYKKLNPESTEKEYLEALKVERDSIVNDLQSDKELRAKLLERIDGLTSTIMYYKCHGNYCENDVLQELQKTTSRNLHQKTQELGQAFADEDWIKVLTMKAE